MNDINVLSDSLFFRCHSLLCFRVFSPLIFTLLPILQNSRVVVPRVSKAYFTESPFSVVTIQIHNVMHIRYMIGAVYITIHHGAITHLRRACHVYTHTKVVFMGTSLFLVTSCDLVPPPILLYTTTPPSPANPETTKYASPPFLTGPITIPRI